MYICVFVYMQVCVCIHYLKLKQVTKKLNDDEKRLG